ncbi:hypothetical protein GCM10022245_36970 [Streptomyces mayteni]
MWRGRRLSRPSGRTHPDLCHIYTGHDDNRDFLFQRYRPVAAAIPLPVPPYVGISALDVKGPAPYANAGAVPVPQGGDWHSTVHPRGEALPPVERGSGYGKEDGRPGGSRRGGRGLGEHAQRAGGEPYRRGRR